MEDIYSKGNKNKTQRKVQKKLQSDSRFLTKGVLLLYLKLWEAKVNLHTLIQDIVASGSPDIL